MFKQLEYIQTTANITKDKLDLRVRVPSGKALPKTSY